MKAIWPSGSAKRVGAVYIYIYIYIYDGAQIFFYLAVHIIISFAVTFPEPSRTLLDCGFLIGPET